MELSVIIVNWNVSELLDKCIASISHSFMDRSYEVIVVDNASRDGSLQMLSSKYPWVKVIANESNNGFARANNQGIEISEGDYILLLNPDTIVKRDTINKLFGSFLIDPSIGMVGPLIFDENGKITPACKRKTPNLLNIIAKRFLIEKIILLIVNKIQSFQRIYNKHYYISECVECIQGACMLMKKDALDKVGYFDTTIPMYLDDNDLCFRFNKKGYKIYYCADAELIHVCAASTEKSGKAKSFDIMTYSALDTFFMKHKSVLHLIIHRVILLFSALLLLIVDLIILPFLFMTRRHYIQDLLRKHLSTIKYSLSLSRVTPVDSFFCKNNSMPPLK